MRIDAINIQEYVMSIARGTGKEKERRKWKTIERRTVGRRSSEKATSIREEKIRRRG